MHMRDIMQNLAREQVEATASASDVIPVILCGGSGTRLWPMSRESLPKHLNPTPGGRTPLQKQASFLVSAGFTTPVVACNVAHRFLVAEQLRAAGVHGATVILEPGNPGTAVATTSAAMVLAARNPDTIMWTLSPDADLERFDDAGGSIVRAVTAAARGRLVMLGIGKPAGRHLESIHGFGTCSGGGDAADVTEFFPKARLDTVMASGGSDAFWHSGSFVFSARAVLEQVAKHAPAQMEAASASFAGRTQDQDFVRLADIKDCDTSSLEEAVMSKTDRGSVVDTSGDWAGSGDWDGVWARSAKDGDGNVVEGDAVVEDSSDCLVRSNGILTAVIGLEGVAVVVEGDAVLVVPRSRSWQVGRMVERLKERGRTEAVEHGRIHRPWGFYERIALEGRFQVKRLVVNPGAKLSLQRHVHRAEHWVVVRGAALVDRDKDHVFVRETESIHLPVGCIHRVENPGRIPLEIVEVQTGSYLGEDDIERFEDSYGRA